MLASSTQAASSPSRRVAQRRREQLLAFLRSIHQDAQFVREVALQYRAVAGSRIPMVPNSRCGDWYVPTKELGGAGVERAYFKSTDGHTGQVAFSFARLNLHVAMLAATRGAVFVVDSTARGKAFPDALSRTVPTWCAVLNRCVERARGTEAWDPDGHGVLTFPPWVHESELDVVAASIDGWASKLAAIALATRTSGGLLAALCATLTKPLRPIWIGNGSTMEAESIPPPSELPFTPVVLVSASKQMDPTSAAHREAHSWPYIQGAGDDQEGWARGLRAAEWWAHADALLSTGSDDACAELIAAIVQQRRSASSTTSGATPFLLPPLDMSGGSRRSVAIASRGALLATLATAAASEVGRFSVVVDASPRCRSSDAASSSSDDGAVGRALRRVGAGLTGRVCFVRVPIAATKGGGDAATYWIATVLPTVLRAAVTAGSSNAPVLVVCGDGEQVSAAVAVAVLVARAALAPAAAAAGAAGVPPSKASVQRAQVELQMWHPAARPPRRLMKQLTRFFCSPAQSAGGGTPWASLFCERS